MARKTWADVANASAKEKETAAQGETAKPLKVEKVTESPESVSTTSAEEPVTDTTADEASVKSIDEAASKDSEEASSRRKSWQALGSVGLYELSESCLPRIPASYGYGEYVALWCKVLKKGHGSFIESTDNLVVDVLQPPTPSAEDVASGEVLAYVPLWCWKQLGPGPVCYVIPCTDKEPLPEAQEPMSAAETACAPPMPGPGSYCPPWAYGPCYPFNVEPTTLRIQNLPEGFNCEDLSQSLDGLELSGLYDFLVVFEDRQAVVNFSRHRYALNCAASLNGKWRDEDTNEACSVSWDHSVQGLNELTAFYADHPCNYSDADEEMRPQLFVRGWPKPLPRRVAK